MAYSHWAGPVVTYGTAATATSGAMTTPAHAGPNIFYQGWGLMNPQKPYYPGITSSITNPATFGAFFNRGDYEVINCVPYTASTTNIGSFTLSTQTFAFSTSAGVDGPFNITDVNGNIVSVYGIDTTLQNMPGSVTPSATSGSVTLTGSAATVVFQPNWVGKTFSGNSGVATITAYTDAQHVTATTTTPFTNTNAITTTNWTVGAAQMTPWVVGNTAFLDPTTAIQRGITVTSGASDAGVNFTINGYDIYGVPVTQTFAGGASSATTTKTFKYIKAVGGISVDGNVNATSTSVGVANLYGFPLRSKRWEFLQIFFNGTLVTSSTGWTAGVETDPATATTGDTRGTMSATIATANNAKRLTVFQSPQMYEMLDATRSNFKSLLGVTQV